MVTSISTPVRRGAAALATALVLGAVPATALNLTLNIREFHGVARSGEPVVTGIPLPKGAYTDATSFRIRGATDYQMAPIVKWPDGSIRWLQAQFFATVPANGSADYSFSDDASGLPSSSLQVTEDENHVIVNTGVLSFKVKKKGGFNLFDEVVFDGQTMVSPSAENGTRITATYQNMLYRSAIEDSAYAVTILEKGPVRALIRVDGHHGNGSGDRSFYDYSVFIHAYAGKSYVQVNHVLANSPYWKPRGALKFSDLDLRTKVNLGAAKTVTFHGAAQASGALSGKAELAQTAADAYASTLGGGTKALGWMDVSDGARGVAVGVKNFWENFPKALVAEESGVIDVSLFPSQGNTTYYIQDMANKEHQVAYYFHKGAASASEVQAVMGGMLNHRLVPVAHRKWYADTRAFLGDLAEGKAVPPHPRLPVINAHIGDSRGWTDGWYNYGNDVYFNDDNARELFHDEGVKFFHTFDPIDFQKWEASVRLEGHKRYHLNRGYRTLALFRTRQDPGTNPNNFSHANYFQSPSANRFQSAPSDPNHWGAGTVGALRGWTSYPEGWIVQNTEHMDVKQVLDWYCFTGDPYAKDLIRDAGEYRGAFTVVYYHSWTKPGTEANVDRVVASSAYNLASYYMVFPTAENLAMVKTVGDYFNQGPGADGFFQTVDLTASNPEAISGFQEGMAAMTAGLLYELSGVATYKQALEKNAPTWLSKIVMPNGYIPYRHTGPTADPTGLVTATASSMYRNFGGGMAIVQHVPGYEEIFRRLQITESATKFGPKEPYCQKFYLALAHANEFDKDPFPSVMAGLKDTAAFTFRKGMQGKAAPKLVLEGAPSRTHQTSYFTYEVIQPGSNPNVDVELTIYSSTGKSVKTVVRGGKRQGTYFATWDCRDSLNQPVALGNYYALLSLDKKAAEKIQFQISR